jgi:hypothetical protein
LLAARVLPLPLALAHIHAIAAGHAILQAGGAVCARRRQVLGPIPAPQARAAPETRQSGRPLT